MFFWLSEWFWEILAGFLAYDEKKERENMAIVHVRIDERLIHGQVAMVWTNTVGASRIIVANDEAVKDDMIIAALKISKPAGVKLSILS